MDCHCPDCPPTTSTQNTWNSWDQDPHNAYNNAFYHYQAYMYYWNLHNAHFGHARGRSFCECYDNAGQDDGFSQLRGTTRHSHGFPTNVPNSRCLHCPDEDYSPLTKHLNISEAPSYFPEDNCAMEFEEEEYDINDDDDDDDEHNFELDERFYQFLEQSEKHRREREREKRTIAKQEEYVEAGKIQINASTLPPEEQQGAKRKEAMKSLYGDTAPYIMSLEASLQLHYDRNFDTRQPKFWPNIPLKF